MRRDAAPASTYGGIRHGMEGKTDPVVTPSMNTNGPPARFNS
jgi:hypothetical protein